MEFLIPRRIGGAKFLPAPPCLFSLPIGGVGDAPHIVEGTKCPFHPSFWFPPSTHLVDTPICPNDGSRIPRMGFGVVGAFERNLVSRLWCGAVEHVVWLIDANTSACGNRLLKCLLRLEVCRTIHLAKSPCLSLSATAPTYGSLFDNHCCTSPQSTPPIGFL